MLARLEDSILLVIDLQPSFLAAIHERERVLDRSKFLLSCARVLGAPALATEQYPERMGGTEPSIAELVSGPIPGKMRFSCCGNDQVDREIAESGRSQVILVGIETHICVNQTAHQLLDQGHDVIICADAVGARSVQMHEIGLRRLVQAGAVIAHTESVVYEWMGSAGHPQFREVLAIVKRHS